MKEVLQRSSADFSTEAKEILGIQGLAQNTHGRFNLVRDDQVAQDFVVTQSDELNRYLVTQANPASEEIEAALNKAEIEQLPIVGQNDELLVYLVPIQAKPLLNEKLFPDRPSTSTYISDAELFKNFGQKWRQIYKATGRLSLGNLVGHIGMKDFTEPTQQFFPIPPYIDWVDLSPDEVSEFFESNVRKELSDIYPHTPIDDISRSACNAFNEG